VTGVFLLFTRWQEKTAGVRYIDGRVPGLSYRYVCSDRCFFSLRKIFDAVNVFTMYEGG
jgi:hypothetical protein